MHELSVCQALIDQVSKIASEENAAQVLVIHLQIGPLSGVEPHLLEQAFYIARAGSIAEDAELVIKQLPVRVSCDSCGEVTNALPERLICGNCGDWHTKLVSGDELQLEHIELIRKQDEEAANTAQVLEQFGG